MKARQGYIGGLNRDAALNKRNPGSYYYMSNFRVVTEGGLSTGSIENEKGHLLAFKVPDLNEMELDNGDIIPAQANLRIIGWCTIVDTIIVFTTNETIENPTNSYGQIWKLEFDESLGTVTGLTTGNFLDPTVHLMYNNILNFTSYHRIGRAIGRYENTNTQRVYWTDNYNPVRVFNVADPDPLNTPLSNIDLNPDTYFSTPNIEGIGVGNLPTGSMIQFAYRLIDTAGTQTLYSPTTNLVPLPAVTFNTTPFGSFEGSGDSLTPNKSVTYNIKGLDPNYDVIEHIAILYSAPGVKTVYKFDEEIIPANHEVTVICSDLTQAIQIPLVEFNMLSGGFDRAKDIEVVSNRLVAANTHTTNFEVDFDARAYRFNSGLTALLQGDPNITLNGPTPLYSSVPLDHDAINPYNQESNPTWFTDQYKYQVDGTTLGGSGPNISYRFVTHEMQANTSLAHPTQEPDHITVDLFGGSEPNIDQGLIDGDASTKEIVLANQYKNFASQWAVTNFTGHARGETYRFGIVFYNAKGSVSFVEWIGDIRFPDVSDGFPIQDIDGTGTPYLQSLGIEFTVNVSSIVDQITGYSIVRVKREDNDKTKLGTGMLMFFDIQDKDYFHTLLHRWESTGPNGLGVSSTNPYQISDEVNLYGIIRDSCFHLADKPGFQIPQLNAASAKSVTYLLSPMGQLFDYNFKAGDYIQTTGYYESYPVIYGGTAKDSSPPVENNRSYAFYYKLLGFTENPYGRERFEIGAGRTLDVGEFIYENTDIIDGYTGGNALRNASYVKDLSVETAESHVPLGLGSRKVALMLTHTPSIIHNSGDPGDVVGDAGNMRYFGSNWTGPDSGANDIPGITQFNITFSGGDVGNGSPVQFKEVIYARYLTSQYGGNSFEDRSKNQYQSTGAYQVVEPLVATTFTHEVWGGDTFVNYYDDEQVQFFVNQETAVKIPYKTPDVNKLSVAICFPCESPVNTNYRTGRHWAADRSKSDMEAYETNDWDYSEIWSQQSETEEKFFAKDFLSNFVEEHSHQLWASDTKIDGELIDRWRIFRVANATEVDGVHGPINRIINFNDKLFFYQDKAFGIASIDERSVIQDQSGQTAILGTGGVFPYYTYISTNTGSYHQFGVVASENALYHYDARLKKIFQFSGTGVQPLSDAKGMSSWFDNEVNGAILKEDKTLSEIGIGAIGVHATPDFRYNRILFTFLNSEKVPMDSYYFLPERNTYSFPAGSYVQQGGNIYYVEVGISIPLGEPPREPNLGAFPNFVRVDSNELGFTISYNEMLGAFESFYDYKPGLYLEYGRRLLSVSPFNKDSAYIHNEGPYGTYYDQDPYPSTIDTIFGDKGDMTKIFNNLEYKAELYNTNGLDIYDETFNNITLYSEYQTTGTIPLVVNDNIKRRMRTWRYIIPRENEDGISRLRNPWLHCLMSFDNNDNKRHVLHEITYSYTPSQM